MMSRGNGEPVIGRKNMEQYCTECGYRILSEDDVGIRETVEELRPWLVGIESRLGDIIEHETVMCRACTDEREEIERGSITEADVYYDRLYKESLRSCRA